MGKILKRFIYGYIALVVAMLIGLVVMTIHHVVSTHVNEWNAKKFVYGYIVELQEEDYETLSTMMSFEETQEVTEEDAKEYIEESEFDKLIEMDLQRKWDGVYAYADGKMTEVYFYYDSVYYGFNCMKIESNWKIVSLENERF